MLNIVLFGPPGAGKGTQSDKIIEKFKLVHFSTGDILRAEIASKTELGLKAKAFMDKGELVPDAVVIGMIKSKILANKNAKGFIFDGFPRTLAQAVELDKLLNSENIPVSVLIALDVEHDELVKRLLGRAKDSGRADDMDINVIENRIDVYNKNTLPVMDFYKDQGKLRLINGIGSIDEIFGRICKELESVK
ncbi:MAG: adenylate kinase [Bacteroidales bacterium]